MDIPRLLKIKTLVKAATSSFILVAGLSFAVDDPSIFELDGNAIVDEGKGGDDSVQVYCEVFPDHEPPTYPTNCELIAPSTALLNQFLFDEVNNSNDDIFAGGKDSLDISKWNWQIKSSNDKNDIGAVFVSAYLNSDDETVLYFGLDKFANNGDAAIGIWFLQNPMDPSDGEPSGSFPAGHAAGDILVQADIENGGSLARYDIYTWGPNTGENTKVAPSQGDLTLFEIGAECPSPEDPDQPELTSCGTVNIMNEDAPWPYSFKGKADPDTFPPRTYFEGGLNLNDLFGDNPPCLRSFIAETRQSQSETAELEDLVYGAFDFCGFDVTKTVDRPKSKAGDSPIYEVKIENTGILTISPVSIQDSIVGDLLGGTPYAGILTDSCTAADLKPQETCVVTYEYTVQVNDPDPLTNTATAYYTVGGQQISAQSSAMVELFTPDVSLDKKADGSDGPITINQGDTVDYSIAVTNLSSQNAPMLDCKITDNTLEIDDGDSCTDSDPHTICLSLSYDSTSTINVQSDPFLSPGPDPYTNTADVTCDARGYENNVVASDSVDVKVDPAVVAISVSKDGDDYSKVSDEVSYTITITNNSDNPVELTSINDNLLGELTDGTNNAIDSFDCPVAPTTLPVSSSCTITLTRTTGINDTSPLVNKVTVSAEDAFANQDEQSNSHSVTLVAPDYSVIKSCVNGPIPPGGIANFEIEVANKGDVALIVDISDPLLGINLFDQDLGTGSGCAGVNAPAQGCIFLEQSYQAGDAPVFNQVDVSATLPELYGLGNTINHSASDTCGIELTGDATRTLGFWRSHGSNGRFESPVDNGYTCWVVDNVLPDSIDLGWKSVSGCDEVMGVFWSKMARESDGGKRKKSCKTQLQASWQLLAAILNNGISNNAPAGLLADARQALSSGNHKNIKSIVGQLDAYNQSGDGIAIVTNGFAIPNADPNGGRALADYSAGDCN